jgi:hypothetical protein
VTRAEFIFQACDRSNITFSRHFRTFHAESYRNLLENSIDRRSLAQSPIICSRNGCQAKDCRAQTSSTQSKESPTVVQLFGSFFAAVAICRQVSSSK